jgi:hypothetical protein
MNVIKQLIVSLYSPKTISTFRNQGMGKTILFVFLLTLLSVLPNIYYFSTSINNGLKVVESTVINEIPSFTIKNGELQSDEATTITINKNDFTIVFDSTGTVDQNTITNADQTIFVLKDELAYNYLGETQSISYSMFGDMTITKDDLLDFLKKIDSFLPYMIPATAIFFYLFTVVIKFIDISIIALFGLALKTILDKQIDYSHLWRLSAYSMALPTLFFTIMNSLNTVVLNGFFIHWFVSLTMLMLTLKEIPSQKSTR